MEVTPQLFNLNEPIRASYLLARPPCHIARPTLGAQYKTTPRGSLKIQVEGLGMAKNGKVESP